jgi:hypothetical protein
MFKTCVIDVNKHLWCWINKRNYKQGQHEPTFSPTVPRQYIQLSNGERIVCAIDVMALITCWAQRKGHYYSDPLEIELTLPVELESKLFIHVQVAVNTVCAIEKSGNLVCWNYLFNQYDLIQDQ